MAYERGPMPDLTPEEWERLKKHQDQQSRRRNTGRWEVCNDPDCRDDGPHGGPHYHDTSAWGGVSDRNRSERQGWTKAGEFCCPYCPVSIGKNLRGVQPFALAREHLKKEHGID